MILAEEHTESGKRQKGREWLVVTQNDHAALAADLLAAWPSLARVPFRELLLRATRRHDNGWQEADSAPRVDRDGRPVDFLGLPARARRELWERGMGRYRGSDPACALLIVEHAIWLHRTRSSDSEIAALVKGAGDLRRELLAEVPNAERTVAELYPWLRVADDLSLRACMAPSSVFTVELDAPGETIRGRVVAWPPEPPESAEPRETGQAGPPAAHSTGWRLSLQPFPFAGATRFPLRCRRIPQRRYQDDADLAMTLASARWLDLSLRVEPADP